MLFRYEIKWVQLSITLGFLAFCCHIHSEIRENIKVFRSLMHLFA